MSDVRANSGVPVIAQFGGERTPSACAPIVVDSTTGRIYSWKTGDVIVGQALESEEVTSITATVPITSTGGQTPSIGMVNQGSTTTVLHGNAAGNPAFSSVSLTADVTGTLGASNGGTGITSFGTGIATWLGTPSSANLRSAMTDETGTGALVFANGNIGVATGTSIDLSGDAIIGGGADITGGVDIGGSVGVAVDANISGNANISGYASVIGDVYTDAWQDYSASSTISGWSSFTTKKIWYKKVGKTVFCSFHIAGTSNSVAADFSLPYTAAAAPTGWAGNVGTQIDNSVTITAGPGRCLILASSASVATYWDWAASPWTSSGTKQTVGTLWYESA